MNTRALTLAIRLLYTAAAGVALGTMTGCPLIFGCGDDTGWQEPETIALGVSADLNAIVELYDYLDDRSYTHLAVGAAGTVVAWGDDYSKDSSQLFVEAFNVGEADLHAALADESKWWVVGDGGMVAVSGDRGQTWTPVDLAGTTANLRAITNAAVGLVVVGDGVVLVQAADGTWSEATAPDPGGWGDLRGVYYDGTRVYAVGLGGVVWSTDDPSGTWVAEEVGVSADLFAVGGRYIDTEETVVVGAQGTLLLHRPSGWIEIDTGVSADLIGLSNDAVLGSDDEVYELGEDATLSSVASFEGARALHYGPYSGVTVVGEGGSAAARDYYECIGGRPFTVDGQLRTASLRRGEAWCEASESEDAEVPADLAELLAAAWAQDGLYEHASIASFARFSLELLALGAGPQLLREAQIAIADELRHAELCFGLARRFGGVPRSPGAMPITAAALARVGDPVATALALFEEGCVNESIAACEAADAAEGCVDPQARRALEIIAADERRHATAAWQALRFLVQSFGEQVCGPLRDRVARLGEPRVASGAPFDPRLAAYGRLSPQRRATVQRRVIAELVRPLAQAMLDEAMTLSC